MNKKNTTETQTNVITFGPKNFLSHVLGINFIKLTNHQSNWNFYGFYLSSLTL